MEKNAVSILNELSQKKNVALRYILLSGESGNEEFIYKVIFDSVEANGRSMSKKNAKRKAAQNVLKKLGMCNPESEVVRKSEEYSKNNSKMSINIVAVLDALAVQNGFEAPVFKELESNGPLHNQIFTVECILNDYNVVGIGYTKKKAKLSAAEKMVDCFRATVPNLNKILDNCIKMDVDEMIEYPFIKLKQSNLYPKIFKNIMNQNNVTYSDLWSVVQHDSQDDFEKVLNTLQLEYCLNCTLLNDQFIAFLCINTIPSIVVVEKAESVPLAVQTTVRKALQLLRVMTV